jgi:molybdenum cofactor cytidylyltransferase
MNTTNSFGILVLAAGQSRRFGSDKLMAKMPDGRPVIAHSLAPTLEFSKIHNLELCVITRADNQPLIDYLTAENISYSFSSEAHLGMGHSIADGVNSNQDWQGWMITLADMPNITLPLLNNLWDKIQKNKNDVVRPIFSTNEQNIPAHPVYFPASYREDLKILTGDNGAKKLIKHPVYMTHIDGEIIAAETMTDVDTKEVLQTLYQKKEPII